MKFKEYTGLTIQRKLVKFDEDSLKTLVVIKEFEL